MRNIDGAWDVTLAELFVGAYVDHKPLRACPLPTSAGIGDDPPQQEGATVGGCKVLVLPGDESVWDEGFELTQHNEVIRGYLWTRLLLQSSQWQWGTTLLITETLKPPTFSISLSLRVQWVRLPIGQDPAGDGGCRGWWVWLGIA